MEFSPFALQLVSESVWRAASRRAYDEGYRDGVTFRSGQRASPSTRQPSFTKDDLLKIEAEVVLALCDDETRKHPREMVADIFNLIWKRVRAHERTELPQSDDAVAGT